MDVNQTVAFEVGAMFLLAVLFMAGTKMKGAFPELGKNVQFVLIAAVILVVCVAAFRMWPEAYEGLLSILPDSGPSAPSTVSAPSTISAPSSPHSDRASTAVQAKAPRRTSIHPAAGQAEEIEYVIKVAPEPGPADKADEKLDAKPKLPAAGAADAPPQENRGKRALKKLGHALHIGKTGSTSPE
jgi:hypothetical protein